MRRRDLLTSYSLVVLADQLPAAPQQNVTPQMRRDFDVIAPKTRDLRMAGDFQEPHMGLVDLQCDVLVAGGGLAGVCTAISAARHGAKVVLLQDRSRLGGNSSSEVKMHIVGADSHTGRPGWRESGLMEELRLDDAVNNPQRCWEMWDLLLYDKVISEPNITLLLETILYRALRHEVMPECAKKGVGVIGMKGCGGDGLMLRDGAVTVEECYHYFLSQPISTQVVGLANMDDLNRALKIARSFKPMTATELQTLSSRVKDVAGDGRYELFKTSQRYDAGYHRKQHGFATT